MRDNVIDIGMIASIRRSGRFFVVLNHEGRHLRGYEMTAEIGELLKRARERGAIDHRTRLYAEPYVYKIDLPEPGVYKLKRVN